MVFGGQKTDLVVFLSKSVILRSGGVSASVSYLLHAGPTTAAHHRYDTVRASVVAQVCAERKQEKPVREAGTEKTDLDLIVNT